MLMLVYIFWHKNAYNSNQVDYIIGMDDNGIPIGVWAEISNVDHSES